MRKKRSVMIFVCALFFLSACTFKWSDRQDWQSQESDAERSYQIEEQDGGNESKPSDAQESLSDWIGQSGDHVIEHFGQPDDVGLSTYGYEWIMYEREPSRYVQFGRKENEIVTAFAFGETLNVEPFAIGHSYDDIKETVALVRNVSVFYQGSEYRFELTDEELSDRPLVKVSDNLFAQLYMDRFTNRLMAIRYLDGETLLKQRPYRVVYTEELPQADALAQKGERQVDESNEKQIFNITNELRERFGVGRLRWNDQVADVAYRHSKEMNEKQYFDHVSPVSGTLENRLQHGNVQYVQAGENIAAEYPDGISATMGWLNSEGHRHILLHEAFTDLGVGVYEKHYTQNFIAQEN